MSPLEKELRRLDRQERWKTIWKPVCFVLIPMGIGGLFLAYYTSVVMMISTCYMLAAVGMVLEWWGVRKKRRNETK